MLTENDIMTDAQVAKLAHVSLCTFQRRCKTGFKPGEIDFLAADPLKNGDRRFWLRSDVERVIKNRVKVAGGAA